jgi:hypothetical protein
MKRRDLIALLGSTAATWPLGVRAQQAAMPVVGLVNGRSPEASVRIAGAFRKGLNEARLNATPVDLLRRTANADALRPTFNRPGRVR